MKTSMPEKLYVKPMPENEGLEVNWRKARQATFPNLKPTSTAISLRLPVYLLDDLKIEANKRDVPYQSLLKIVLADWLKTQHKAA